MKKYKKTTLNIPIKMYEKIKQEAEELGVSFTTMVIFKLNKVRS